MDDEQFYFGLRIAEWAERKMLDTGCSMLDECKETLSSSIQYQFVTEFRVKRQP